MGKALEKNRLVYELSSELFPHGHSGLWISLSTKLCLPWAMLQSHVGQDVLLSHLALANAWSKNIYLLKVISQTSASPAFDSFTVLDFVSCQNIGYVPFQENGNSQSTRLLQACEGIVLPEFLTPFIFLGWLSGLLFIWHLGSTEKSPYMIAW